MKPKKLERYYDDDDMYYLKGLSTRPEPKPMLASHLVKLALILLCSFFGVAGLIVLIGKIFG